MGTSYFFITKFLLLNFFLGFLCDFERVDGVLQTHTIQLSSLLPSASCKGSHKSPSSASLKLYHKHGPCMQLGHQGFVSPNHTEILKADQARVDWIRAKLSRSPNSVKGMNINIPAKSGKSIGTGNYVVTVGLGTPKKDQTLDFDTGSSLTWTQCEPCAGQCYDQVDAIFNPSLSSSYSNVSCSSNLCQTDHAIGCYQSKTCVYGVKYGDGSITTGFLATEKLTLTSTDSFDNFLFGCGQENTGLFHGAAGLIGLGRDSSSFVEQTATKYGRYFSYCLPSTASSTGHLTFGKDNNGGGSTDIKFTPLSTARSLYGISILGIYVGGQKLPIATSIFSDPLSIIDSGTVITRLPLTAYTELKRAFKQHMTNYPTAPENELLDTCYDLSNVNNLTLPKVGFMFSEDAFIDLPPNGILYQFEAASKSCLAFAANEDDISYPLIYGNTQQQTFEVVYDVAALKLGFGANGCA